MTDEIRRKKHSQFIRDDIKTFLFLKRKHADMMRENPTDFEELCIKECNFLFNHYTDIFNKVKKDEIDLKLLNIFLDVLRDIENGNLDQHEGSFKVGTILKEMYIDSALKKSEKLDRESNDTNESNKKVIEKKINWSQWKRLNP